MNIAEMPDGNSAAELAYDRDRRSAEKRQDALQQQFPIEDFRDKALCNLADEANFEALLQLHELAPTQMLVILLKAANKAELLPCGGDGLVDDPVLLGQWFEQWVADEQERLQAEAIERAL